jgi:hypothetical protein
VPSGFDRGIGTQRAATLTSRDGRPTMDDLVAGARPGLPPARQTGITARMVAW